MKYSENAACLAMQLSGSLNMGQPKSLKTLNTKTQALSGCELLKDLKTVQG